MLISFLLQGLQLTQCQIIIILSSSKFRSNFPVKLLILLIYDFVDLFCTALMFAYTCFVALFDF